MEYITEKNLQRCPVCDRCHPGHRFAFRPKMCYHCHVEQITWCSPWFLDPSELGVPRNLRLSFMARQTIMRRLLLDYLRPIGFPITRFRFSGEAFIADPSMQYGFRSTARGFDLRLIDGKPIPNTVERTLRIYLRGILKRVVNAAESLDEEYIDSIRKIEVGILYFMKVSSVVELIQTIGTLGDDDEFRAQLFEILDVISAR